MILHVNEYIDWVLFTLYSSFFSLRSQPHVLKLLEEFGLKTYEQDVSGKKILKLGQGDIIYYDDTTTYGLSLIGALDVYFGLKKVSLLHSPLVVPTLLPDE